MKIYVGHAGQEKWDFEAGLYRPLLDSDLAQQHEFILSYQQVKSFRDSEDIIKSSDLLVAEVSYASLGLGIEMAWARQYKVPVLAIHQKGTKPSSSVQIITDNVVVYEDSHSLIDVLEEFLSLLRSAQ